MPDNNIRKIGNVQYHFDKNKNIYCNRSVVIPSDEEIQLSLGIEDAHSPGNVKVEMTAYFTLPTFLRIYDSFKQVLDDFKKKGLYKEGDNFYDDND